MQHKNKRKSKSNELINKHILKCKLQWTVGYFMSFILDKVQWFSLCSSNSNIGKRKKGVEHNVKMSQYAQQKGEIRIIVQLHQQLYSLLWLFSTVEDQKHFLIHGRYSSHIKSQKPTVQFFIPTFRVLPNVVIRRRQRIVAGEEGAPALWSQPPVHCHTKHNGTPQFMRRIAKSHEYSVCALLSMSTLLI